MVGPTMDDGGDEFEEKLKEDLPRGLAREASDVGVDRGLLARWAQPDEMQEGEWEAHDGGLLMGYREGRLIGWNDNRHLLTIAGSRAGKGVSLIIPNLIFYQGSAVVIDPKGENAARTARRRGLGAQGGGPGLEQDVYVLDPFGESGLPTNSFNPLFGLNPASPDVIEDIGLFADALITHNERDRHWTELAQALLRALILLVLSDGRFNDRRNLITVRQLLMLTDPAIGHARVVPVGGDDRISDGDGDDDDDDNTGAKELKPEVNKSRLITAEQALIRILLDQGDAPFGYICVGVGEQLQSMGSKERGSILSSARTQTQWLDSPKMPAVLTKNDLDLADLKRSEKGMTVYLLPATRMATHAGWLRLIVLLAIAVMEKVKGKPKTKRPVLFVLDEFAVLGYLRSIEMAAGLMAGFGVQLWPIVQNVGQLKQHYSKTWETFFANAGAVTAFG